MFSVPSPLTQHFDTNTKPSVVLHSLKVESKTDFQEGMSIRMQGGSGKHT